jgi:hypothetical protein
LYIEEVPDYESTFEEESANMETILNNPNAAMILQSPLLLKYFGKIREPEKIAAEVQKTMQQQNAMEQGMPPNPNQAPQPQQLM